MKRETVSEYLPAQMNFARAIQPLWIFFVPVVEKGVHAPNSLGS